MVLAALVVRLWLKVGLGLWAQRGGVVVDRPDKWRETRRETVGCGWVVCSSTARTCGCCGGLGEIGRSDAAAADEAVCKNKKVTCVGYLSKDTA